MVMMEAAYSAFSVFSAFVKEEVGEKLPTFSFIPSPRGICAAL